MGARRFISDTGSKRFTGASGFEDAGKRTRSDLMETVNVLARVDRTHLKSVREREKISLSHEAKQAR